jgi:hypothetical protein
MGVVKIDIHKSERNFKNLSLSDTNVVKWLILYRDKIDLYYGEKTDNFYNHAGNVKELNAELVNLFVCLDDLIDKCKFKEEQLALLKLLFMGYTFKDIEDATQKATSRTIKRRFESICRTITEMNERLWKIQIHKTYLSTEFRKCSKCESELPLTDYFFYKDKKGKDGYRSNCKKCTA